MTVQDIYKNVTDSALSKVGVESVYHTEPYNSWNVFEVKYGSVCVFIDSVIISENEKRFNINLYYGEILTETADNLFSAQNTAVEVIYAIIDDLRHNIEGANVDDNVTVTLFKQKFTDILGGGYCSFSINMITSTCPRMNKNH